MLTHREFDGHMWLKSRIGWAGPESSEHSSMSIQVWGPWFLQPDKQLQWYEPAVLTHTDCTGQEFGTSTHSLTSLHVGKRASFGSGYHPLLHVQVQLPGEFTQVECGSQPWIPRLHSFMSTHWNSETFSQPELHTQ